MITSPKARDAFDLSQESPATHARYGKFCENFLIARRLVEAGVSVVTLKVGDWDTHEKNFIDMRDQLPQLDRGFHALVTDLHERGLDEDVAVVLWGEFGRAPRISRGDGRDHWPEAGAAVMAGGGFNVGQAIGQLVSSPWHRPRHDDRGPQRAAHPPVGRSRGSCVNLFSREISPEGIKADQSRRSKSCRAPTASGG